MTQQNFDKRVLLVRLYRGISNGWPGRTNIYMPDMDAAKKAFSIYTQEHMNTEYCALFSPKDKRGVRRQLKRYVWARLTWRQARKSRRDAAKRHSRWTRPPY
jgi:hypothetical protein